MIPNLEASKEVIQEALKQARAHPVPLAVMENIKIPYQPMAGLKDRKEDHKRPTSIAVELGHGFRANVSFEEQPIGLCIHLSVGVAFPEALPSMAICRKIVEAFGMQWGVGTPWVEEWQPNYYCVNLVQLAQKEGTTHG